MADKEETFEERDTRIREGMRREHNALAHDASPFQAGEELVPGDARDAKLKEAKQGARKEGGKS